MLFLWRATIQCSMQEASSQAALPVLLKGRNSIPLFLPHNNHLLHPSLSLILSLTVPHLALTLSLSHSLSSLSFTPTVSLALLNRLTLLSLIASLSPCISHREHHYWTHTHTHSCAVKQFNFSDYWEPHTMSKQYLCTCVHVRLHP